MEFPDVKPEALQALLETLPEVMEPEALREYLQLRQPQAQLPALGLVIQPRLVRQMAQLEGDMTVVMGAIDFEQAAFFLREPTS